MADLIGDTSTLTATRIPFAITHVLTGQSGHGHFNLLTASGLRQFVSSRATATIVRDRLQCQLVSGVSSDKSYQVAIGFMPDNNSVLPATDYPVTARGILRYSGSIALQRSELANPLLNATFPIGVSNQLKPAQLAEWPPVVVYHFTSEGTDQNSTAILRISGEIEATGFGFVKLHSTGE